MKDLGDFLDYVPIDIPIISETQHSLILSHGYSKMRLVVRPGVEFHDGNHGKCRDFFSLCRDAL